MEIIIGLLIIIGMIIIYFAIPWSPLKKQFLDLKSDLNKKYAKSSDKFLSADELTHLPKPVQKFFQNNGYIGQPKSDALSIIHQKVAFYQNRDRKLTITYTQHNYTQKPLRIALIESSLFGVPFDGLDALSDQLTTMKEQAAKLVTIFDERGEDILRGAMLTYLSEALILPSVALQPFVSWEEVDDKHAKATLTYYDQQVSGVFEFNNQFEMISFQAEERSLNQGQGKVQLLPWSITAEDYQRTEEGLNLPRRLKAIWHYPDEDLVYFDSREFEIKYY